MSNRKCPAATSRSRFLLNVVMVALGAVGLYYLSIWVSLAYIAGFVLFFFVVMPLKACQYCYFRTDEPLEEWKEKNLQMHAESMKKWGSAIFLIWGVPIAGIVISFFFNFSAIALVCLIGFVALLSVSSMQLNRSICAQCAILDVCPLKRHEH